MTRIYRFIAAVLLTVFFVSCGSDESNKAKSIIKNQTSVIEDYVNGLADAEDTDEVVAAIELYTENMKKLIPELQEFQKNYPEYKQGKIPEGMEADFKRLKEASAELPGPMMKDTEYMMEGRVQTAMAQMDNEMSKLQ